MKNWQNAVSRNRLAGPQYVAVQADADRWLNSEALKVRFVHLDPDRVVIEDVEEPITRVEI